MNLTNKQKRNLVKFFDKYIANHKIRVEKKIFSENERSQENSYFVIRKELCLPSKQFEISLATEEKIIKELEKFWNGTELKPLAKELMKLTKIFIELQQNEDVSPFIYEMF